MRALIALCIVLTAPLAAAAQARPFDHAAPTREDARFLQAGLAFDGAYAGRIDGEWGPRSRAALRAAAVDDTEAGAIATLLGFLDDYDAAGWETFAASGTAALLPARILWIDEGPGFLEMHDADRTLVIRFVERDAAGSGAMHDWLVDAHAGVAPPYRAETAEAFVTRGTLPSGREVYLRSVAVGPHSYETVVVQWEASQAARARVVVASLSSRPVAPLIVEAGGYIDRIVSRADPPARGGGGGDGGAVAGGATASEDRADGSGTGFYVNETDIVTAAHVVGGCARLTLEDEWAATVVAVDATTDLAVLRAARRSARWLALGAAGDARLGAPVTVVGYPYLGLYDQGLSVTTGNVSALRGLAGEAHVLMLTAPVQPGNSGGPILGRDGAVLGVVSYRASERYALERSGTLPQNMNAATRLAALAPFLAAAGIRLPPAPGAAVHDVADGLPPALSDAVVAVRCHAGP